MNIKLVLIAARLNAGVILSSRVGLPLALSGRGAGQRETTLLNDVAATTKWGSRSWTFSVRAIHHDDKDQTEII